VCLFCHSLHISIRLTNLSVLQVLNIMFHENYHHVCRAGRGKVYSNSYGIWYILNSHGITPLGARPSESTSSLSSISTSHRVLVKLPISSHSLWKLASSCTYGLEFVSIGSSAFSHPACLPKMRAFLHSGFRNPTSLLPIYNCWTQLNRWKKLMACIKVTLPRNSSSALSDGSSMSPRTKEAPRLARSRNIDEAGFNVCTNELARLDTVRP
jgi:hypothetical protein